MSPLPESTLKPDISQPYILVILVSDPIYIALFIITATVRNCGISDLINASTCSERELTHFLLLPLDLNTFRINKMKNLFSLFIRIQFSFERLQTFNYEETRTREKLCRSSWSWRILTSLKILSWLVDVEQRRRGCCDVTGDDSFRKREWRNFPVSQRRWLFVFKGSSSVENDRIRDYWAMCIRIRKCVFVFPVIQMKKRIDHAVNNYLCQLRFDIFWEWSSIIHCTYFSENVLNVHFSN